MFTFGRDHEKACALEYVKDPAQHHFVERLVDAAHDVLEGAPELASLRVALETALAEGGSGVWEQGGIWLRKLSADFPDLLQVWVALASHPSAPVRFRAAAHLTDMPPALAQDLGGRLLADRSWKVREKAASDLGELHTPVALALLKDRLLVEAHERVVDSINWAIEQHGVGDGSGSEGGA